MTIAITAEQRDALYEQLLVRLSGIGDVWLAAEAEEFGVADRLGREFCDDLRLILDDFGWGGGTGAGVELSTAPEVLRRVLGRLREAAMARTELERRERVEAESSERQNRLVREVCDELLSRLGEGG